MRAAMLGQAIVQPSAAVATGRPSSIADFRCRFHVRPVNSLGRIPAAGTAKDSPSAQQRQRRTNVIQASNIDLSALGLDVPEIDASDVTAYQEELGAEFDAEGVAVTFNNTDRVLEALKDGVVLVDRSHWGRLRVAGKDRLDLLHNQSTADFKSLTPGTGCDTVFVTATARCLDLATALVLESSVMVITSPTMRQPLLQRLDKYIFPADDVTVSDVSNRCRMFTIMGPQSDDVLQELAGDALKLQGQPYCRHQLLKFGSRAPVILAVGTGLAIPGYTLIVDDQGAADLYATLINKGCVPMGEADWERARITQGRPAAAAELTEDYNPLEAGLSHAVSLSKGCYIGQETLAKVTNTNGVKQQLWGLQLSCRAVPGADITAVPNSEGGEGEGVKPQVLGKLTSYVNLEKSGHFGLGYLRCKKGGAQVVLKGMNVLVDGEPAKVVDIPYATRQLPVTSEAAAGGDNLQDRAAEAKQAREAEKAAQAAAKAERLKAMQERLAAFQAQQQQQRQQQQ